MLGNRSTTIDELAKMAEEVCSKNSIHVIFSDIMKYRNLSQATKWPKQREIAICRTRQQPDMTVEGGIQNLVLWIWKVIEWEGEYR